MLPTLVLSALLYVPAADAKKEPPAKLEMFAKEEWYQTQEGKEQAFVGVVHKAKGGNRIGFGRFNPYRLEMKAGKKVDVREIYVGGKRNILDPYVGKSVKITGKAVTMGVEGKVHREIWPARLVVVETKKAKTSSEFRVFAVTREKPEKPKTKGPQVLASAYWQYQKASVNARGKDGKQLVLKSAAELVNVTPFRNLDALPAVVEKSATDTLAKALKVKTIDWNKQMLLVITAGSRPTGGYSVAVTALKVQDKTLVISWKVNTPRGFVTQAFTHPGIVVLVDRFDGKVQFAPASTSK